MDIRAEILTFTWVFCPFMWNALQCNSGWYMSDAIGLHFIAYFINSVLNSYDSWFKGCTQVCINMFSLLWPLALAVDLPQRSLPEDIPDYREKPELWWKLWVFMRLGAAAVKAASPQTNDSWLHSGVQKDGWLGRKQTAKIMLQKQHFLFHCLKLWRAAQTVLMSVTHH